MHRRLTKKLNKIAKQRLATLQSFQQLRTQTSASQAAKSLGVSRSTLWLWQKVFAADGILGLTPKYSKSGRRSAVAGVQLTPEAVRQLEVLLLETGNPQQAWRRFVEGPHCPPAVARMNIKGLPAPVARLVQPKALQARCNAFVSADGQRLFIKFKSRRNR